MIRRLWSEQVRITFWAWIATLGAAIMLGPLTESKRYLVVGALGAAVVATIGALLRARRAHLLLVLAAEAIVAFWWAILLFARDNAILGIVPGPDAVSDLGDRWSNYADTANQFAAPLPKNDDVTMAMSLVMVALAVVVDVIAVSWRRASLLGLVFLAVYMTPVSILGGEISLVAFLFGALGFVFLLAADERERLTHWGRQISTAGSLWDRPNEVDEGGLRRNGTRVGLSAIALAAVLPILVPTLSPHYFGQAGSGGSGGSDDGTVSLQDDLMLDLRRNLGNRTDEVMLQVSTTNPEPEYFRLAALDEFTGSAWEIGTRDEDSALPTGETIPPPPGLGPTISATTYSYQVQVTEELGSTWLPIPYAPTSVEVEPEWVVDPTHLDVRAGDDDQTTSRLSYAFAADDITPTLAQLSQSDSPPANMAEYLDLPDDLPGVFRRTARELAADAQADTPYAIGKAIEGWLSDPSEFEYSIENDEITQQESIDDLVDFLTEDKVGYCEQFASVMAIMARAMGIPSRVAVGFLEPDPVDDNTYEFKGTDMHAWPELYINGVGWYRFEPTPNTEFSQGAAPPEPLTQTTNGTDNTPTPTTTGPTPRDPRAPDQSPTDAAGDDTDGAAGGGIDRWWWAPVVLVGIGLILGAPRMLRAAVRRRRWAQADSPAGAAEAAWAELRDHVVDLRMDWDPGSTPRAIGRSLRERLPDDRQSAGPVVTGLNQLVLAIEQARYARAIRQPEGLREAVQVVEEALSSRQTSRQRMLARWLPISLLRTRGRRARVRSERLGELLVSVEE